MGKLAAVVFDLDGTLVRYHGVEFESSWGAIAAAAGVQEDSERLVAEYITRQDAYREWVTRDAALLAGIPVSQIAAHIFPPPYARGVRDAIAALRGRYVLGIISSGIDLVADYVKNDLELDFALANRILVEDGRFTGESEIVVDLWSKDEVLRKLAAERGIPLDAICFVGDHINDIPVMRIVGLPVAVNPKDDALLQVAAHVIADFSELPALIEQFERGD